jgi:hypothetical protein
MAFFRWFYDAGDTDVRTDVEARWDPDLVLIQAPEMAGTAGEFHGYAGLAAVQAELSESFPKIDWNPIDAVEADDGRFLVFLEPKAETNQGLTLDQAVVGGWLGHVITLADDGRVKRLETYLDEEKAREAAGLDLLS